MQPWWGKGWEQKKSDFFLSANKVFAESRRVNRRRKLHSFSSTLTFFFVITCFKNVKKFHLINRVYRINWVREIQTHISIFSKLILFACYNNSTIILQFYFFKYTKPNLVNFSVRYFLQVRKKLFANFTSLKERTWLEFIISSKITWRNS